jgi:hypothetical protein
MSATARTLAPLVLFVTIALSLLGALAFGFVQLLWLGQPLGANGGDLANVCLYIFGAASLVLLIFRLHEQKKAGV